MCCNLLSNDTRTKLGAPRPIALCAIALVGCLLALAVDTQTSLANATVTGNVLLHPAPETGYYSDNPFTSANEGIPATGNRIDLFLIENGFDQINWEGRPVVMDPPGPAGDENENFHITVGHTSFGELAISGVTLNDMNLYIGDQDDDLQGELRRGTGVVRIFGAGSTYNNDPWILPFVPPTTGPGAGVTPENISVNPRLSDEAAEDGFDLYLGYRGGTGTLLITEGGRAEIQDAVVIGNASGSTGTVIVDGVNSFLGSGGFEAGADIEEAHHMIIGRFGLGFLTIRNGGQVVSEAPTGGQDPRRTVGAVIGSDPFDTDEPEVGGQGTVTVSGLSVAGEQASKWIIGGSLQVGGFHDADESIGMGLDTDFEGDDVEYSNEAGRGTLIVENGGIVNVLFPADTDPQIDNDLLLAIGRFGRVKLDGGYISIGAADPTGEDARSANIQVINDGVIEGGGRIDTGVFRNRYLGQVRVGPAQSLLIDSSAEFDPDEIDEEPLINFGLIEVIGTVDARAELEIIRGFEEPDIGGGAPLIRPFFNRPLPIRPPAAFDGGLISAQHADLRFGSGIQNEGTMAFTAGTNVITGRVDNISGAATNGRFLVFPNTTVVVQDDFSSGGLAVPLPPAGSPILTMREGGTLIVLDQSSFTLTGHLDMTLSFTNPSLIEVSGDVGLRANLFVSFDNSTLSALAHGDSFELIYFAGFIGGVDETTDPVRIRPDLSTNPILNVIPDTAFQLLHPNLNLIAVEGLQSMYLFALDPSMVGTGGAMGADFNGDGIVDLEDLAIWEMFVGLTMGASVLQGDADGDGDVDGEDFLIWQASVGPVPGAGSGSGGDLVAHVPEPAGLAMLLTSGLLALAIRHRRAGA